jgi:hypothetical protein
MGGAGNMATGGAGGAGVGGAGGGAAMGSSGSIPTIQLCVTLQSALLP